MAEHRYGNVVSNDPSLGSDPRTCLTGDRPAPRPDIQEHRTRWRFKQAQEAVRTPLEQAQRICNIRVGHLLPALMDQAPRRVQTLDRRQNEPPLLTHISAREGSGLISTRSGGPQGTSSGPLRLSASGRRAFPL